MLTEAEKTVLARGLRFCLPPKDVDKYDVKCSFELFYRDLVKLNVPLTSENQDRLRNQLKNISYNYIYSYDFSKQKNILSKDEWKALNDLRSDDSIIITKPDKGNGIVIVSRLDYLNKMKQLLSDNTKFKPLTSNPTKAREESLSSYLRKLNLVPRASFPLTSGRKTRALGATISGMRHRCRCAVSRITRIRLFPLFFHNGCSQSSRFPTAGQGERSSGNEIGVNYERME